MHEIIIREPQKDEYQQWANVYRAYLDFYQTSLTEKQMKKVWSWISQTPKILHCFFAQLNGQIIGLAHFRSFIRPIKASSALFLDDLIVLPKYHGVGAGFQLIESLKSYAKEHDLALIRWITAADNEKAMKLYDGVAKKTTWVTYDMDL
jgi:ribosomal protein S18 acetylase RimI-like enzyme